MRRRRWGKRWEREGFVDDKRPLEAWLASGWRGAAAHGEKEAERNREQQAVRQKAGVGVKEKERKKRKYEERASPLEFHCAIVFSERGERGASKKEKGECENHVRRLPQLPGPALGLLRR